MSGIFAMYYTGASGLGHALFIMKDGVIVGADAAGGVLEGTYKHLGNGQIEVDVALKLPPGAWLVTGAPVTEELAVQQIKASLPENLGDGNSVPVQTPTGPVNVIFKRLRDVI